MENFYFGWLTVAKLWVNNLKLTKPVWIIGGGGKYIVVSLPAIFLDGPWPTYSPSYSAAPPMQRTARFEWYGYISDV